MEANQMMKQNQMMRAYKDGNRLVIVIENADTTMHKLVETMLACAVRPVEYLEPEADQAPAPVDTTRMEPVKTPRFVKRAEEMRTVEPAPQRAAKPAVTPDPEKDVRKENGNVDLQLDTQEVTAEDNQQQKIRINKPISKMNIFEVREYLVSQRTDERLKGLLRETFRTDNLEFVLYTKSEKNLKNIAFKLAG